MKKVFSIIFYSWLLAATAASLYTLFVAFHLVWIGVLLVVTPPLINTLWPYDNQGLVNTKVLLPKVSLLVMIGIAWVFLTLPERGWALWFALGGLGGFLLNTYWVESK
jgi:hypothetical protein